jgi:hypothetical protein
MVPDSTGEAGERWLASAELLGLIGSGYGKRVSGDEFTRFVEGEDTVVAAD